MSNELYMQFFYIGAGLSALMLVVTIMLFFNFNIIKVVKDLKCTDSATDNTKNNNVNSVYSSSVNEPRTKSINVDGESICSKTQPLFFDDFPVDGDNFTIENDITIINTDERID